MKATLEKAGYNARYEMFNMPIWHENAAPVLQLTSPSNKTYRPGSAADDNSPSVDFIAVRALADEVAHERQGRADQRRRDPQPGWLDERL